MREIAFLGDVYLKDETCKFEMDTPYIFNFEYVATDPCTTPMINKINLSGRQDFIGFKRLPLAVNLANNHILDFLDEGFLNTIEVLENNHIKYFGAGNRSNNFHNPCMIECGGEKIALIGYSDVYHSFNQMETTYDVARPERSQIEKDIALCKQQNISRIIINIHWGREERFNFTKRQQELGRLFIDLGASVVIGHHSHCIQPVEIYKDHYIFYSLGNTYFPDINSPAYFNMEGKSEFVMHKKQLRYGRKSLMVNYDIKENGIKSIQLMEMKKGSLEEKCEVKYDKIIPKRYMNQWINEISGYCHMLGLFIRSYLFADGKLFSIKAIKKELEFFRSKKK